MLIRFANFETAAIVLISVIALFFFPAPRGSFVSTHGPMTEMRTRYEAALFWLGMAVAALRRLFAITLSATAVWLRAWVTWPPQQEQFAFSILRI